ncbi:MAG TPA: ATP-binding protein [Hanamia sp.]
MQRSEELAEVATVLFQQVKALGVPQWTCGFSIFEIDDKEFTLYPGSADGDILPPFKIPLTEHPVFISFNESRKRGDELFVYEKWGEYQADHYRYMRSLPGGEEMYQNTLKAGLTFPAFQIDHIANFSHGNLLFITYEHFPEMHDVFKRFAKVFEQTYTRFLDLQKAEAQAREAQIELGLERVRARAMAMQKSDELSELVDTVFKELTKLDFALTWCIINIIDESSMSNTVWAANPDINKAPESYHMLFEDYPFHHAMMKGWKERKTKYVYTLEGLEKKIYDEYLFRETEFRKVPEAAQAASRAMEKYVVSFSFSNFGGLQTVGDVPLSDANLDILSRFGKVFDLTYTRFNDFKKAEAQTREAQIEAALEKVRGKAMAMHNSSDVSVTASMVFTELRKLGISPIRCGVGLLNKESRKAQLYSATSSAEGDSLALVGWVELSGHPVVDHIYSAWLNNADYFPELSGEQLQSYYQLLLKGLSVNVPESDQKHYGTFLSFTVGCLYTWSETPYSETEIKILKRFANIIDLTFRRYIELQQSETNAKEAVKQAALDRIRADIASMRTISDLDRITPLIWKELTIIGIPFIRCGVFIMDDLEELIHTFLSTPDGEAIAAFHLPYTTPGNIADVLSKWQHKEIYINHWNEDDFKQFADMLVQEGGLASSEQYLKTIPHGGFYLHFLPFLQGMLYVGNTSLLSEDEIKLIQSVAEAFSTAYARYEDFNKLEAAKKQVDSTLNELQVTQKQLIQSEKMASLGELTAGIAHEIQNPLNFVNNFSEVNQELLVEMKDEMDKGNIDDAREIVNDVIANEEKINHHGKRADAIVKGMLEHSKTSTGKKEPTDINKLADEYLRLSYHGLRAKDKEFNAEIKTDFDEGLGTINVIPQDIGRVLLNLYNNAFYAVTEKKKSSEAGYEPTVSVSTKKIGDKVEVRVKDNGNGIPQKVVDKIFQPFFTTKPTGVGTGLGLSLSYDIVKAHGGEIKVETKEGEGSEFIIQLPIKTNE